MRIALPSSRRQQIVAVLSLISAVYAYAAPERQPDAPHQELLIKRADDAKTVLAKAIKAHGGADKLSRWSKGYVKYKSTVGILPVPLVEAILEDTFDLPGHFKRVIRMKKGDEEITIIYVHNHGKGWVKTGNTAAKPDENNFTEQPEHTFAVLCDFSKLCGQDTKLKRLPDEKIGDYEVAVINAKTPGGIDVDVFIDKKTGWVIRTRKQQVSPGSQRPINMIVMLEGHKVFQGGVYPTKIKGFRDEKALIEVTILDLRFLDSVDKAEFKKP